MDTMVHFKGILKTPIVTEVDGGWFRNWFCPRRVLTTFKSQKLTVRHRLDQELRDVVDKVMQDMQRTQGLVVVKDETKPQTDASNLQFWPLHNFSHIEIELKVLTVPIPAAGKETVN
jgi:hypothetical protein